MKILVALIGWLACVAAVIERHALHVGSGGVGCFIIAGVLLFLTLVSNLDG